MKILRKTPSIQGPIVGAVHRYIHRYFFLQLMDTSESNFFFKSFALLNCFQINYHF